MDSAQILYEEGASRMSATIAGMDALVGCQAVLMTEAFAAIIAGIGLLPLIHS